MITSMLNFTGFIFSEWTFASLIIIFKGLVLELKVFLRMSLVLLLYACAATGEIFETALLCTDHVENLSEMESFFVALNVINFLFRHP